MSDSATHDVRTTRSFLIVTAVLCFLCVPHRVESLAFSATGRTFHGDWVANVVTSHDVWSPGTAVDITIRLRFEAAHMASLADMKIKADKLCVLVTAERTFDADGWMRLASDERMSTLQTPTGLPIEGGVQGAVTNRYGYAFKSPLDQFVSVPIPRPRPGEPDTVWATYRVHATLPNDLPPGLYRLRIDFGVMVGTRVYNFNGYSFASRPFSDQAGTATYVHSPIIPASGPHVSGRAVDAERIQPRFPWLLLQQYNSNGYRGVIADQDRSRFALCDRSIIADDVILPMYDDNGNRYSYTLEPVFPTDTIDALQNIPWNFASGEYSVRVTGPDGSTVDLGTAPFVAKSGNGPTTRKSTFTAWRPQAYGRYTVTATGWIADVTGRRYQGGGTYPFWIAKRMTLATATFQGMPYPVGSTYGRDTQFNPPLPANVRVTATLYVNSDVNSVRTITYSGTATAAGLFGAAQGMKSFPLDAPGEYHAQVLATYTDAEGHLWVSTMRHAGVVYAEPTAVIARGKKFLLAGKYVDRGETNDEGYVTPEGSNHLTHITFPYNSGDVLLTAAEGQGANKVEPVLIYEMPGSTAAWDTSLNGVGVTNLRIKTSNGYSPHQYPEYITDLEYYYAAAPRPGFMGRFIVGESNVFAPYWPVSPNSFGNQIGASANGDAPGDIYRLIGGVVLRRRGQNPMYAGYLSSLFLLPKGTNNNRVVAAGAEDLHGPIGQKARFFLTGLRPGSAYEVGATFRPVAQIDPLLPVSIRFVLTYPDGRQRVATGTGDRFGSWAGPTAFPLDVPGMYTYQMSATWNGHRGGMPGLPDSGGHFFVYSKTRPAGATGLRVDGNTQRAFAAATGVTITGSSTATSVQYAVITPGAVIEQGELPVTKGKFQYVFDPVAVNAKVPLYDIVSITTGRPQIGRVVHVTFFAQEKTSTGATFHDFVRVILRGTSFFSPRTAAPASASAAVAPPAAGPARAEPVHVSAADVATIRRWDQSIEQLARADQLRLLSRDADAALSSRTHERLQQYHEGTPVFGADLTRQLDGAQTMSMFGTLYLDIPVGPAPSIDADAARVVVSRIGGGTVAFGETTLGVLPTDGGYVQAWRVETRSAAGGLRAWFVDATTGRAIANGRIDLPGPAAAVIHTSALVDRGEPGALAEAFARLDARPDDGADATSGREAVGDRGDANAAVVREAFARASNGGVYSTPGAAVADARGRDRMALVFGRAFTRLLPSSGTFATARAATIQAARDLYGAGSATERAVAEAWSAVGVR